MSRDRRRGLACYLTALLIVSVPLAAEATAGTPPPSIPGDAVLAWHGPLEAATGVDPGIDLEETASCGGTAPLVRDCKGVLALDGTQAGFWIRLGIEFTGPLHATWSTETGRFDFDCFYYAASLATCTRDGQGLFYAGQILVLEGRADLCCTPAAGFWEIGATVT